MQAEQTLEMVRTALDDLKARDIRVIDVRQMTAIMDYLVIASGSSDRHVRSIADNLAETAKATGQPPLGIEGQDGGEWVLVDLQDVVVHVMQPRVREFYKLEDLWSVGTSASSSSAD